MRSSQQIAVVAGSKLLALASLFVGGILVARTTGPAGFGYYNAGLAALLLLDAIVGQPLDTAMIRFNSLHGGDMRRVDAVQGAVLKLKLAVGVLIVAAALLFPRALAQRVFDANAPMSLPVVVAVSILCLLAARSTSCFLQIHQRFRAYALLDALQAAVRLAAIALLFATAVQAPDAYVAVYGAGSLLAFALFAVAVPQHYLIARMPDAADLRRILSYIGITSAIIILGTITGRIDVLLVMMFGGAEAAGQYSAAAQVAFLGALFAGYMAVVFQPKVVQYLREGVLGALIRQNALGAAMVALLCIPAAIWVIPWLMPALFGDEFVASVPILQILLIGTCADLLIMPILLPFSIQVLAKEALIGELIITASFFALVAAGPGVSAMRMAWIVSGVRIAKLAWYLTIVLRYLAAGDSREPAAVVD